jgi:NADH dehydrogenase
MLHRIVIVGGGAGGLELATQLGDRLGRSKRADITLVDRNRTHIWKPLLHEIAAGSMDLDLHELEYLAQARWHHFQFKLGSLEAIDRQAKQIRLSPIYDEDGALLADSRLIPYDSLAYPLELFQRVITVSLETMKIVKSLPRLDL